MAAPKTLTEDYLVERWPRLFHMAEAGSWPSIRKHGLLSTSALLDRYGFEGERRREIEARRRPKSVELVPGVWIRDNRPITEKVLARTLVGMTPEEWYRSLNGRVFFWLSEDRLSGLRGADAYRGRSHDVLVLDTAKLMRRHGPVVELSPYNSGAVHPASKIPRGPFSFAGLDAYPWCERLRTQPREPIVELTVPYALGDVEGLLDEVREA